MGLHQPDFDPAAPYVALTGFRAGGVVWTKGAPIDHDVVPERSRQLLYEGHKIGPAPAEEAAPAEVAAVA